MKKFSEKKCDCSLPIALATPFQPHSNWSFRKCLSLKLNPVSIRAGLKREKKLEVHLGWVAKRLPRGEVGWRKRYPPKNS